MSVQYKLNKELAQMLKGGVIMDVVNPEQAKIAEELRIAPGTAHTHVKRIYSKTDLHSRQAILDYIEQYAD